MLKFDDFPLSRVPADRKASFLSVAIVHMGMITALDQFMMGAVLGNSMTLSAALVAIAAGGLLFGLVTWGLGLAGMREGISGSLLARWCGFGRNGSVLIGLVVAVSLLGWFGVQNAIFARSLNAALHDRPGFPLAATASGLFLTFLVAFGFRALKIAARIAVPLFVSLIAFISYQTLKDHTVAEILLMPPTGHRLSISAGITIVVGGAIVASLITPDLTRYSRNSRQVFGITLLTVVSGEVVVNGLAILISRVSGTSDIVAIMSQGAGNIGLLIVVFSTLRINDINLYSSTLGIANAVEGLTGIKLRYTPTTIVIGILGTTLSVLGILDMFVDFLTLLGVIFPPVIGVMLMDYYVLKTHREALRESNTRNSLPDFTPDTGWMAIIASLVGCIVGLEYTRGVPAINSIAVACLVYVTGSWLWKACDKRQRLSGLPD
jgi:cytosine permease